MPILACCLLFSATAGCASGQGSRLSPPAMLSYWRSKPSTPAHDDYASRFQAGRSDALIGDSNAGSAPSLARTSESGSASGVLGVTDATKPISVALGPPTGSDRPASRASRVAAAPNGSAPSDPNETIRALVAAGRARLESLASYQVQFNRQERVGGTLQPAENVVLSIRQNPKAVRLEWPDGPNQGREALYSPASGDARLHVKMPGSLIPPMSWAPDSPIVLSNSRHPITEAGFDTIFANIERALTQKGAEVSNGDRLTYGGLEQPTGLPRACHKIVRVMPNGETWVVYLDPQAKLPTLVQGNAGNGELLERYVFQGLQTDLPQLAQASAFDPDSRWGSSRGLLGKLARGGSSREDPTATR
jgi:hypothetical protein